MHPQEIPLVFKNDQGKVLPTRHLHTATKEAKRNGSAFVEALQDQVMRQSAVLVMTAAPAVTA
jgi:hypothetical protein